MSAREPVKWEPDHVLGRRLQRAEVALGTLRILKTRRGWMWAGPHQALSDNDPVSQEVKAKALVERLAKEGKA